MKALQRTAVSIKHIPSHLHPLQPSNTGASELHANVNQSMWNHIYAHTYLDVHMLRLNCSLIAAIYKKGRFTVS